MTTRIFFDNQSNIQFRLTDGDGNKYINIMPISYHSLDLPYYGIGAKLERIFTLTSRTPTSPGIIRFSINNYGANCNTQVIDANGKSTWSSNTFSQ